MKVLVPNRSFFGKILGSALLAMTLATGASAMHSSDEDLGRHFSNNPFASEDSSSSDDDFGFNTVVISNSHPEPRHVEVFVPVIGAQQGNTSIDQGQVQETQVLAKTQDIDQCTDKEIIVDTCKKDIIVEECKKDIIVEDCKKDIFVDTCKKDIIVECKKDILVDTCKQDTTFCGTQISQGCQSDVKIYGANMAAMDMEESQRILRDLDWQHLHARAQEKTVKGHSYNNISLLGININNVNLAESKFCNVAMIGNFHDVNFNGSELNRVTFQNPAAKISNKIKVKELTIKARLKTVKVRKLSRVKNHKFLGFRNVDLKGAVINNSEFDSVFFQHRWKNQNSLENSTINNTIFSNSILDGLSLKGAKLIDVKMPGSVFTDNLNIDNAQYCTTSQCGKVSCVKLTKAHLRKMGAFKTKASEIAIKN